MGNIQRGDALKEKLKAWLNSLKVTIPSPSLISPLLYYRTFAKASAQSLFRCQVRDLVLNTCALYLDTQIKAKTYPGFRSLFLSLSSFDVVWFIIDRHEFNMSLLLDDTLFVVIKVKHWMQRMCLSELPATFICFLSISFGL